MQNQKQGFCWLDFHHSLMVRRSWVWSPATTGPSASTLSVWVYLGAPVSAAIRTVQVRPTVVTCRKRQLLSTDSPSRLQQHSTYIRLLTICSNAHIYGHDASSITTITLSSNILCFYLPTEVNVEFIKSFSDPFFPHIVLCLNTFWSYVTSRYSFASSS